MPELTLTPDIEPEIPEFRKWVDEIDIITGIVSNELDEALSGKSGLEAKLVGYDSHVISFLVSA